MHRRSLALKIQQDFGVRPWYSVLPNKILYLVQLTIEPLVDNIIVPAG